MTEATDTVIPAEPSPARDRHRPTHFILRGDRYAFSRLEDGVTLGRLDPYCLHPQRWKLLSGWILHVTGADVRDISKQVHDLDLPDTRPEGYGAYDPSIYERLKSLEDRVAALEVARPADEGTTPSRPSETVLEEGAQPKQPEEEEPMREIDIRGTIYKFTAIDALTLMGAFIVNLARDPAEIRLQSGETVEVTIDDVEHIGRQLAGKEP